jgi:hypothetical protein
MDVTQSGIYNFWSMFHQDSSQIIQEVANDRLISAINQTAEQVSINASKISLEGLVTVNGKFTIDQYGSMTATGGTIANFTINNTAIYNGTNSMQSTTQGVYIGTDGIRQYNSANAYINMQNGVLTANGVDITGNLKMTDGYVNIQTTESESSIASKITFENNYQTIDFIQSRKTKISSKSISLENDVEYFREPQYDVSDSIDIGGYRIDISHTDSSSEINTQYNYDGVLITDVTNNVQSYFTASSVYAPSLSADSMFADSVEADSIIADSFTENGTTLANKYATISSLSNYATVSSLSNYATISSLNNYFPLSRIKHYAISKPVSSSWTYAGTIENLLNISVSPKNYLVIINLDGDDTSAHPLGIHLQKAGVSSSYDTTVTRGHIETTNTGNTFNGLTLTIFTNQYYNHELYIKCDVVVPSVMLRIYAIDLS